MRRSAFGLALHSGAVIGVTEPIMTGPLSEAEFRQKYPSVQTLKRWAIVGGPSETTTGPQC